VSFPQREPPVPSFGFKEVPLPSEVQERIACVPQPLDPRGFNPTCVLPYGLTTEHIPLAMEEFLNFLGFINQQLNTKSIPRFETMLMPANFSSLVGEFVIASIPKYCATLAKNRYHNGHPDLVPTGRYPGDAVQYADEGVEIKASRCLRGWQGHNPEDAWLWSSCSTETDQQMPPKVSRRDRLASSVSREPD
jgi:hypothetical protein